MRIALLCAAMASFAIAAPATAQTSCSPLRWTTLGTAGGPVPTMERAEPSNLLTAGNELVLVDTGDGTVNQLAKVGLTLGKIRHVVLSHLHLDHTGGLAAVIGLRWMNQFPGRLTVHGPPGTQSVVDGIIASLAPPASIGFGLGSAPPSPRDSVTVVEVADGANFTIGDVKVRAVANSHFDHPGGEQDGTVSLSYRFEMDGRSIAYTGDTGPAPAVTALATGADLLVSEVIDLDRLLASIRTQRRDASPQMLGQMAQHLGTHHLLPADLGAMAAEAGVGHLVLTHFAIPGPLAESEPTLRDGVREHYAGPLDLARDLASFDVGCLSVP